MHGLLTRVRASANGSSVEFFARINLFGLGLLAFWTVVDTTLLPNRVRETAPGALAGSAVGLVTVVGVGLAMIVQPVAGRISDTWARTDRRRPFILGGALLAIPGLLLFGFGSNFALLLIGFALMQLAMNFAQAAFQALIPDLVDEDERGLASGVKNGLSVVGAAVGLLGAQGLMALTGSESVVLGYLAVLILGTSALTVIWTPKRASQRSNRNSDRERTSIDPRVMIAEFRSILKEHRIFRLGVIAQYLFLLGSYPAQRFLLMFLEHRFGSGAQERASIGVVIAIGLAIASAAVAGVLSDTIGQTRVLAGSVVIGSAGLIGIGFSPTISAAAVAGALIAIGLGAFQSVNWAMMNRDLPPGQAATALGIANIATAGAGATAGLFGPLVDGMNALFPQGTYQTLFGIAGCVALTGLLPIRAAREAR